MGVAIDGLQVFDAGAGNRQQLKMDGQEGLANNMQPGRRQERMNVGHAPGDRVFDRNHGEVGRAVLQGRERVLESGAGQWGQIRKVLRAGDMRIGPGLALISNGTRRLHGRVLGASMSRARERSSGASTPSGAVSTSAMSIRMPASSARNCSSLSRRSSGDGGRPTNRHSPAGRYA